MTMHPGVFGTQYGCPPPCSLGGVVCFVAGCMYVFLIEGVFFIFALSEKPKGLRMVECMEIFLSDTVDMADYRYKAEDYSAPV